MKKSILYSILLMALPFSIFSAQPADSSKYKLKLEVARNAWYIELGGNSLMGSSFNYERFLSKKPGGLSIHAGVGFTLALLEFDAILLFPMGLTYGIPVSKNKKNFLEVNTNYVLAAEHEQMEGLFTAGIGYRYQSRPKGFFFRVNLIPVISLPGEGTYAGLFWGGLHFGSTF